MDGPETIWGPWRPGKVLRDKVSFPAGKQNSQRENKVPSDREGSQRENKVASGKLTFYAPEKVIWVQATLSGEEAALSGGSRLGRRAGR